MKKRIVSLLLCLALLCAVIPAFAFHADNDYVELKSSKSAHFYTLPTYVTYWENLYVDNYPACKMDDVPLVRDGKLLIPANYEGAIVLTNAMGVIPLSQSADDLFDIESFTVFVKPATAPKMSAKFVDDAIEVKWQNPINNIEAFQEFGNIIYGLSVKNADTGDEIIDEYMIFGPSYDARKSITMTETGATIPLKGRNCDDVKYNIEKGTNLKIEFSINLVYANIEFEFGDDSLDVEYILYTHSSTELSIPEDPVIFKPVTNFCIGRKLDKRNAVGKTVKLVRGVKEKFRIFGVQPADATEPQFIWKSLNPKVVSVTEDGIITAKKLGTAVIKVKAVNTNVVKSFKIKVVRPADKK